jgi:hemerythrin
MDETKEIVLYSNVYKTGIELIDNQHKELVNLTNELYQACLAGTEAAGAKFKETMGRMVEYVRFHFTFEMTLLERVKYPHCKEHKSQHDTLVKNILEAASEFNSGKHFVANNFVRTLKDWIFGHIDIFDREYSAYILEQLSKGLLSDRQITG